MSEEQRGGPTLVIIDDESEFVKTVNNFFVARGYEVHTAMTGTSGVELIDAKLPHVVLVDLKLSGMDGDEVLKYVRRNHPDIKVIMMTAYNDGGKTRERLLRLGAHAHFDKPLSSLRELSVAVKEAVAASN